MNNLREREEGQRASKPRLTPTSVMLLLMEFLRTAPVEVVQENSNLQECIQALPTFDGNECYNNHYDILLGNEFINDDRSLTPKGRNFCHNASSIGVNFESIFRNGRIGFCIAGATEAVIQLSTKMNLDNNTFNIYEGTQYHNNLIDMKVMIEGLLENVISNNVVESTADATDIAIVEESTEELA